MSDSVSSVWLWIVAHQAPCLWDSPSNIYFVLSINSVGLLSLVAQTVKNPSSMWETWLWSLGWNVPCRRAWQPTVVVPIYILYVGAFPFLHILSSIYLWIFLMIDILTGVKYYLPVVLTCIALIVMLYLLAICMSGKNVYVGLFPIFSLDCLVCWYWVVCVFWRLIPC